MTAKAEHPTAQQETPNFQVNVNVNDNVNVNVNVNVNDALNRKRLIRRR